MFEAFKIDHPKYKEISERAEVKASEARLAFRAYLDLTEAKGWWNVDIVPCCLRDSMQALDDQDKPKTKKTTVSNETKQGAEEIKSTDEPSTLLFLTGHETQHHEMSVALACSADRTLTCAQMHAYVEAAKEQFNTQRLLLALVSSDSTVVYYQLGSGLLPPERPEELEAKRQTRFRYQQRRRQRHVKYKDVFEAMEAKAEIKRQEQLQSANQSADAPAAYGPGSADVLECS